MDMNELGYDGRSLSASQLPRRSETAAAKTPWTSARCNRLLRPLSSKLALLRKEGQSQAESNVTPYATTNTTEGSSGNSGSVGLHPNPARALPDADAEWESNPRPRKKIKRTYSAKARIPASQEIEENGVEGRLYRFTSEAVIGLPSQLTLEARPCKTSTPIQDSHQYPKPLHAPNSRDSNPPQEVPKNLAPHNWKLVDGICKGLVALLKATELRETRSTSGCRSLLSICLRQAPKYIAEEELLSKADDPDSGIDVSSAVYSDLEEFGSMLGGGWEPLREVVRAHGIKMFTDAIEEGLLGPPVARHLFYLCLDVSAYDEAQCIIESLSTLATPTYQPWSKKTKQIPHDLHMIINNLDSLASRSGRQGFLYRHTAAMLDRGILAMTWISSRPMIGTWNGVIQSIAQQDEDAQSATFLIHTAVAISCRKADASTSLDVHELRLDKNAASHRPTLRSAKYGQTPESIVCTQRSSAISASHLLKEADCEVRSTLSSVLTVLSAITRLRTPAGPLSSIACNTWITVILQDLSLGARQAIDSRIQDSSPNMSTELHTDSLRLPLLAAGLAELPSSGCSSRVSQQQSPSLSNLAGLSSSNEASSFAGSFICAVARCCGRARSEDPFWVVQAIVQDLIKGSKSVGYDALTQKLCSDLALAAAFAYSEDTSRPNHLDWALQIESSLTGKGAGTPKPALVRTPARSIRQSKSGYRWEEGICEWIAKTPDLLLQKPSDVRPDIDHMGEPVTHVSEDLERTLPIPSELSPCAMSKKPAREAGRPQCGETKALHVLIQPKLSTCGQVRRLEKLISTNSCQRYKGTFPIRPFPKIYEDDDIDELSTPDSSQKETVALALTTMQEPPSISLSAKRKGWTDNNQNTHASKSSILISSIDQTLRTLKHNRELDIAEDELAVLFKW